MLCHGKALSGLGEKDIRIAIFDLDLESESRIGEMYVRCSDLNLQKTGKIAIQNRPFDLDLQHC